MEELKNSFCGTWNHARDENFRESMEASKMAKEDIDFITSTKPTMTIKVEGNKVVHSTELMKGVVDDVTYELDKEFEAKDKKSPENPLYHNKVLCTFKDGKLTYESRSQLTGPRKFDNVTVIYIKDGELVSETSPMDDRSIVGKRFYKKA
ncbi:uncharacterized protein LOC132743467 [Ruditapes philippinarum]|uniref:uncharacterized protein LOC132743467 n=1 Tax=Ruditapes philippinarum TaxID=129788 RepID=UPI00295B5E78|nr:uncharacterized protein LOC132743467 [Ruditapes philippinarum]